MLHKVIGMKKIQLEFMLNYVTSRLLQFINSTSTSDEKIRESSQVINVYTVSQSEISLIKAHKVSKLVVISKNHALCMAQPAAEYRVP